MRRSFEPGLGGVVSLEPQPFLHGCKAAPKSQWVTVNALWYGSSDRLMGLRLLRGRFEGKGAMARRSPFPVACSAETTPPSWAQPVFGCGQRPALDLCPESKIGLIVHFSRDVGFVVCFTAGPSFRPRRSEQESGHPEAAGNEFGRGRGKGRDGLSVCKNILCKNIDRALKSKDQRVAKNSRRVSRR